MLMSKDFFVWEPGLGLDPSDPEFGDQLEAIEAEPGPPSPVLLKFVEALLSRHPNLSAVSTVEDTIWAVGDLSDVICGRFINVAVLPSKYEASLPWFKETAHAHGLHFYDPQTDEFCPFTAT